MSTDCNPNWQHAAFSFYRYTPSIAAAALFCVLFFLSTILHLFQMWKTRCWYLTPLVVGCFCAFIPSPSYYKPLTIALTFNPIHSWVYWVCWPSRIWSTKSRLLDTGTISYSKHVYFACTGIIRSVHLYDTRPNHYSRRWARSLDDSSAVAHQNIRHWRRRLLLTSCWRCDIFS